MEATAASVLEALEKTSNSLRVILTSAGLAVNARRVGEEEEECLRQGLLPTLGGLLPLEEEGKTK